MRRGKPHLQESTRCGLPESYLFIITRSGRAVNAYVVKMLKVKPHVETTFKFFAALMAAFDFPLSSRYNSLHGPISLCGLVAAMAYTRSCGNNAAKLLAHHVVDLAKRADPTSLHLPTSQWGLKMIAGLDHDRMEAACKAAFRAFLDAARERGMIPLHPIGMIDDHSIEYYGKKGDKSYTIKSKSKNGTTTFDMFLTSAIRAGRYPFHTAMRRVRRNTPMSEYLKDILAQNWQAGIACAHWLVDRRFFSIAAMREFGNANEYFLMYARLTPGIKKALAEYMDGKRAALSDYIVKSGRGKFAGVLAFVEKKEMKEDGTWKTVTLPFFSNLPLHLLEKALAALPAEVKKRWTHETSFRVAKLSKPMTTSNSPSIRTFLFWASLAAENLWVMTDHRAEIERRKEKGMPPLPMPPPGDEFGAVARPAPKTIYNLSSKEFLRMVVSEAARLLTMDKQAQDDYIEKAAGENAQLISPMISRRPLMTGANASGIPRWG